MKKTIGFIALLVFVALEVGLIPARALQTKLRRGHQPTQPRLAAFGALAQR